MRSAERELIEIERKKNAASENLNAGVSGKTKSGANDALQVRVQEITEQIAEESKRLAAIRAQLQRMKKSEMSPKPVLLSMSSPSATASAARDAAEPKQEKKAANMAQGRATTNPVPEELYPELCRYSFHLCLFLFQSDCIHFFSQTIPRCAALLMLLLCHLSFSFSFFSTSMG